MSNALRMYNGKYFCRCVYMCAYVYACQVLQQRRVFLEGVHAVPAAYVHTLTGSGLYTFAETLHQRAAAKPSSHVCGTPSCSPPRSLFRSLGPHFPKRPRSSPVRLCSHPPLLDLPGAQYFFGAMPCHAGKGNPTSSQAESTTPILYPPLSSDHAPFYSHILCLWGVLGM
jgi:hypothetical protein